MKSGSYRGLSRYFNQIQEAGSLRTNYGFVLLLVIHYRLLQIQTLLQILLRDVQLRHVLYGHDLASV